MNDQSVQVLLANVKQYLKWHGVAGGLDCSM